MQPHIERVNPQPPQDTTPATTPLPAPRVITQEEHWAMLIEFAQTHPNMAQVWWDYKHGNYDKPEPIPGC